MDKSGRVLVVSELASEYGFRDIGGALVNDNCNFHWMCHPAYRADKESQISIVRSSNNVGLYQISFDNGYTRTLMDSPGLQAIF